MNYSLLERNSYIYYFCSKTREIRVVYNYSNLNNITIYQFCPCNYTNFTQYP